MVNNTNLQAAKDLKDDEFYTTYESIVEELTNYSPYFKGMVVFCNCDDPYESNFCKFFLKNFNALGLKRLICTSYLDSKIIATQLSIFGKSAEKIKAKHGYVLDVTQIGTGTTELTDEFIKKWLIQNRPIKRLKGNGDFRSKECLRYLQESDIVVTNPPFSLFKELVSLLVKYKKKFLLIGNQNALTYKEIFPLIQNNEAWTGYKFGDMKFRVPKESAPRETRFWIDKTGQKWRSLGNAMWLTNLDITRRHEWLTLSKRYSPLDYPTYDNYTAINVKRVEDIPMDYPGVMGVPITIINKYNPEQFELIGEANHGSDNVYDLFKPLVNGKLLFKRILIRNKKPMIEKINEFKILDLFCGAGGFSYGMEKNQHFRTILSLDNDPYAGDTFKKNMPSCNVIIGDITSDIIKEEIIKRAKNRVTCKTLC